MLESRQQYEAEKQKEAEWNKLFEQIIQYSPFGKFYGYMIGASNQLTKRLPKRIAVDNKTGRPYVQYKGDMAKFAGVWGTATHKAIAKDLSEKHWGRALGDLLGGGHIKDMIIQTKKKGVTVYDLSPDDVSRLWAKKIAKENPEKAKEIHDALLEKENEQLNESIKPQKQKTKKLSFLQKLFRSFSPKK